MNKKINLQNKIMERLDVIEKYWKEMAKREIIELYNKIIIDYTDLVNLYLAEETDGN